MDPGKLPVGHGVGRKLTILALTCALMATIIWLFVTKVQSGEAEAWLYEFKYHQDSLFDTVFYAWKFPWD